MTGYAGAVEKGCSRRPICRGLACRFNWTGRGVSRAAGGMLKTRSDPVGQAGLGTPAS